MFQNEWYALWMLGQMKKGSKKIENFEFQPLRDVVKEGGDHVMEK